MFGALIGNSRCKYRQVTAAYSRVPSFRELSQTNIDLVDGKKGRANMS